MGHKSQHPHFWDSIQVKYSKIQEKVRVPKMCAEVVFIISPKGKTTWIVNNRESIRQMIEGTFKGEKIPEAQWDGYGVHMTT